MTDEKTGFFTILLLVFISIFFLSFFAQDAWCTPLLLIVWGLLGLFRLVTLTTAFHMRSVRALPQKLLATIGLTQQNRREDILNRIFLFPSMILWMLAGLWMLILCFQAQDPAAASDLTRSFWMELGHKKMAPDHLFQAMDFISYPFLCGLVFMLCASHALDKALVSKSILILYALLFLLLAVMVLENPDPLLSSFAQRAIGGGFWFACLPALMALLPMQAILNALLDGFKGFGPVFLSSIGIFILLAGIDMTRFSQTDIAPAITLGAWAVLGLQCGYTLFETQKGYAFYQTLRQTLGISPLTKEQK